MITGTLIIVGILFLIAIINDNNRCRTFEHDSYDLIQEMRRQEEKENERGK